MGPFCALILPQGGSLLRAQFHTRSTAYQPLMAAERAAEASERTTDQDRIEPNLCESEPPVERRPVDVTTRRTTPQRSLTAAPSPVVVKLNGGVPWIPV